ncbi:MAG: LLM class flavin-dependent oxidoreductase [Actinobacteria bacterium]|nr:LLM class flavin-dependent oxidoreductase [Actinomycetota bacterium]
MRFVMLTENETLHGQTHHRRWWESIEEAVCAEEMGWDVWGTSEHHFLYDLATCSAPESFYAAVAMKTSRIRLRFMSLILSINNPIRCAERIAAIDILSNGRVELTTARGNTLVQLDAFNVPLEETAGRSEEALEIIVQALSDDSFAYNSRYWGNIPRRSLTPNPVQTPHPPLYKISQSVDSAERAGRNGLGVITSDLYLGWEYLGEVIQAYKRGAADPRPVGRYAVDSIGTSVFTAYCCETNEEAMAKARRNLLRFAKAIIVEYYPDLSTRNEEDYGYTAQIAKLRDRVEDVDFLRTLPPVLVGDPEHWIETLKRHQELGADEVVIRIDGDTHEEHIRQIEAIGKYVIPHFKSPGTVVTHGPVIGESEEMSVEATAV